MNGSIFGGHESRKSVNDALKANAVMWRDRKICSRGIKIIGDRCLAFMLILYCDRVLIKIIATSVSHAFDQSRLMKKIFRQIKRNFFVVFFKFDFSNNDLQFFYIINYVINYAQYVINNDDIRIHTHTHL